MIPSTQNKIVYLKHRMMKEHFINICQEWVEGCVEWFLSQDQNISNNLLYEKAMEQWLLADLEDEISTQCLPTSIQTNSNIFTLDGNYPLQMQYLIDCSESPYDQLRELYNQKLDEAEEEVQGRQNQYQPKKKRLLKLELTDGYKTVHAMEYTQISCLNAKLLPGCKILLKGPMRCANKVIFLESKNVKLLGGEVEKLSVVNAFENVLLKALNRPLKDNPRTEYNERQVVEQTPESRNVNDRQQTGSSAALRPPQSNSFIDDFEDDDLLLNVNLDVIEQSHRLNNANSERQQTNRPTIDNATTNHQNTSWTHGNGEDDDDDDDLIMLVNDIPEIPVNNRPQNTNTDVPVESILLPSDESDDDFAMLDYENQIEEERRMAESNLPNERNSTATARLLQGERRTAEANQSSNLSNERNNTVAGRPLQETRRMAETNLLNERHNTIVAATRPLNEPTNQISNDCQSQKNILSNEYEFKVESCSFVTIDQLLNFNLEQLKGNGFVLKAEINNVFEKLQIKNCQFSIGVELKDGSENQLKVHITDEVVTNIAGVSARELQLMRRKIPESPHIKAEMEEIFTLLKDNLENLNTFMKIDFADYRKPFLIQLIDESEHLKQLHQQKLLKEKILRK